MNETYINSTKDEHNFIDLSINCEKQSDSEPDSGKDNSIWLSLSLTFLFFGLLF